MKKTKNWRFFDFDAFVIGVKRLAMLDFTISLYSLRFIACIHSPIAGRFWASPIKATTRSRARPTIAKDMKSTLITAKASIDVSFILAAKAGYE